MSRSQHPQALRVRRLQFVSRTRKIGPICPTFFPSCVPLASQSVDSFQSFRRIRLSPSRRVHIPRPALPCQSALSFLRGLQAIVRSSPPSFRISSVDQRPQFLSFPYSLVRSLSCPSSLLFRGTLPHDFFLSRFTDSFLYRIHSRLYLMNFLIDVFGVVLMHFLYLFWIAEKFVDFPSVTSDSRVLRIHSPQMPDAFLWSSSRSRSRQTVPSRITNVVATDGSTINASRIASPNPHPSVASWILLDR